MIFKVNLSRIHFSIAALPVFFLLIFCSSSATPRLCERSLEKLVKLRAEVQKNGTYKVFIVDASDKNVETWLSKRNASPNGEPFDSSTILGSAQGQDSAINDYLAERKGFWIIYDRKRLPVELRYGSEDSFFQLTLQTKSEKGNTELKSLFWKRLKELQRGKSPIAAELKTITEENKIVVQR